MIQEEIKKIANLMKSSDVELRELGDIMFIGCNPSSDDITSLNKEFIGYNLSIDHNDEFSNIQFKALVENPYKETNIFNK